MKTFSVAYIVALLGLMMTYLLLGSHNPTIDAWGYAASIKHGGELFSPHHLGYNATGYAIQQSLLWLGWQGDTLRLLQVMNGFVALGCLLVLGQLLKRIGVQSWERLTWVILAGVSFGVMRFATTNETYLWPILWSLLASWAFVHAVYREDTRWLVWAGTATAVAMLYHQLHICWWIGLGMGVWRIFGLRGLVTYSLPAVMVPLAYVWVFSREGSGTFLGFVLSDFQAGTASVGFSPMFVVLTGVNLVRSWVQVHGIVGNMLSQYPLLWALLGMWLASMVGLIWKRPWQRVATAPQSAKSIAGTHRWIAGIHLLAAFLSAGNAEFMVMLPFLLPLTLVTWLHVKPWFIGLIAGICWLWNVSMGLYPLHHFDYYQHEALTQFIQAHPQAAYLLRDKNELENRLYYQTGQEQTFHLFPAHRYLDQSPALDSLSQLYPVLYTDDLDKPLPTSRASLVGEGTTPLELNDWQEELRLNGWLGEYGVYRFGNGK